MKILSWNCRGLGRREKKGKIRSMIIDRKIDIVLLQETKLSSCTELDVKALWPKARMDYSYVDSDGNSGGLLCIWDPGTFQLSDCCCNRSFILLSGTILNSFECVLVNVYAPNVVDRRRKLWDTLVRLKSASSKPWCLGGDFNEIRCVGERIGCSRRHRGMLDFNSVIESCELSEVPLLGRKYTWCSAQEGVKWSKLDRFLVNPEWLEVFKLKLWGLPRILSDHCPLILMEEERDWGPRPFRFINAWLLHHQFSTFFEKVWKEARVDGWVGFILQSKLKLLREALRNWNREVFGDVSAKLKNAEEELNKLDLLAETRALVDSEKARRNVVNSEVWKLSRRAEWIWLQKARLDWVLKGDKNTRYFHVMATSRQSKNGLYSVTVGDRVVEDPGEVKLEVCSHFKKHFSEDWKVRPSLDGVFRSVRNSQAFKMLEAEFAEEELWEAIKNCDGNKAPGPDGFNLLCFQKHWKLMKGEVIQFMKEFHTHGKLVRGINSSFITLVPKKENAGGLEDFRPISLVGSLYKILSKVLSCRLSKVLPEIISEAQSAFLRGRNILDGVLIANEVVDGWKKAKRKGVILKLDFEKAFDSVNWEFLFSLLSRFGFGDRWIAWIKECVSTARLSVLVNGSPTEEFSPQKGLRQGDPLSPFLFIIVAECLNVLLSKALDLNLIKGVRVGVNDVLVSHLQFADDSILFCEADEGEIVNVKRILRCFELVSGLKINYHKSVVCGVGVDSVVLVDFAAKLNCKTGSLPLSYLGLPLGVSPSKRKSWTLVIEKVKARLAGWKRRMLSFAGRLVLIKSALSCLPVYYLSLFRMPEGVAKDFERIQAAFLWGGLDLKRKVHLVKWEEVTNSIENGGLGVRKVRVANSCLLLKWWWRFACESKALWRKVICSKYNIDECCWLPISADSWKQSKLWRDITSLASFYPSMLECFLNNFNVQVGDGCRIRFWEDLWCDGHCLRVEFPRLFSLSKEKKGALRLFVDLKASSGEWNLLFRRELFEWERVDLLRLVSIISPGPLIRLERVDYPKWSATSSGLFSVASLYKHCSSGVGNQLGAPRMLWNKVLPPKVQFFGWLAWKHKIKTSVFLQKIEVLPRGTSILCCFCKHDEESVLHVLLHCHFVWMVWSSLLDWWGLSWAIPGTVDCLL
ncbi:unnamed protein product [Camellia sinensis]